MLASLSLSWIERLAGWRWVEPYAVLLKVLMPMSNPYPAGPPFYALCLLRCSEEPRNPLNQEAEVLQMLQEAANVAA